MAGMITVREAVFQDVDRMAARREVQDLLAFRWTSSLSDTEIHVPAKAE